MGNQRDGYAAGMSPSGQKQVPTRVMAARKGKEKDMDITGKFFFGLLVFWFLTVLWRLAEGQTNLWPVVAGFVFFEGVNRILSSLVANPSFLPGLQAKDVDDFLNIAVSLLHSSVVSVAVVGLVVRERFKTSAGEMWTHEVLTARNWPWAFTVLEVSTGYSAYDQLDMLRRRLYKPESPSLLVHHVVLLTCFTVALYKNTCINYLNLTLLCEVHSVFLHLRKVLIMVGASRKWTFALAVEWTFNWFAFIFSRIVVHVLVTLKLLLDSRKFERGVELPLGLTGMAALNVLNFTLGQGIYKAYLRERAGKFRPKEASD